MHLIIITKRGFEARLVAAHTFELADSKSQLRAQIIGTSALPCQDVRQQVIMKISQ
jgi:hypothetical protein